MFQRFPLNTELKDHSPAVTKAPLPFATGLCQASPVEGAGGTRRIRSGLRSTLPVGSLLLPSPGPLSWHIALTGRITVTLMAVHLPFMAFPHSREGGFLGSPTSTQPQGKLCNPWTTVAGSPGAGEWEPRFLIPSFCGCAGSAFRVVPAPRPALPLVANNTLL